MFDPRPLTYRAEIIVPLIQSFAAGECCSVIGINGIGKTNMLQQLQRPEVAAHYATGRGAPLVFCSLDTNMLSDNDGWGFFEGLAEALAASLHNTTLPPEIHAQIAESHADILAAHGAYPIALRRCAAAIAAALAHVRLVIILDEFDMLLPQIPAGVLRNLRGLRDRHKYQLMYLTLTREPLATICSEERQEEVEPFLELFALRELGLHPLGNDDARREVARFAMRHQRSLPPASATRIIDLSGGHPGLLRAITQAALNGTALDTDLHTLIASAPTLRSESLKLWDGLSSDEQGAIWHAHGGGSLDRQRREDLVLKGLLHCDDKNHLAIFSPLLAAVVKVDVARTAAVQPNDSRPKPIIVDRVSRKVCYYGQQIGDKLSQTNFRLLAYLFDHYGVSCSKEDVAQAIYPGDLPIEDSARIGVRVRRLADQLKAIAPNEPRLLHTMRGQGYRLGLPPN